MKKVVGIIALAFAACACDSGQPTGSPIQAAIDACGDHCVVDLPPGVTDVLQPLELCHGVVIRGAEDGSSELHFTGTDGLRLRSYAWCRDRGLAWHGRQTITNVLITGTAATSTNAPTAGLMVENHFELRRVRVRGFTIGIHLSADSANRGSNANGWRMEDVQATKAEHAGVWFHGGDSNTGLWTTGGVSSNCTKASKWNSVIGVDCAGVIEASFLGNTLINIQTASNWEHKEGCTRDSVSCILQQYPGFRFSGSNQRSLCIGCYTEQDQIPSVISPNSIALGGLSSWTGSGMRFWGTRMNSLRITNSLDPNNRVEVEFGNITSVGGAAMAVNSNGIRTSWPLRFRADPVSKTWFWDVGNSGQTRIFRIVGDTGTGYPLGTLRLKSSMVVSE